MVVEGGGGGGAVRLFAKAGGLGDGGRAFYKTRASGLETSVSLQISEETFASPECLNHVAAGEEQALAWRLQTHSPVLSGTVLTWASGALSGLLPPVRSVRSSHRQLTSQFHSLTPAVRRAWGLG